MSDVNARNNGANRRVLRGFTLLELIVTVAIVAILVGLAFPSFGYVLRNNRIITQTNDLVSAFTLARNEAVTRSRGVTVCAADTRDGVPSACGDSGDWEHGWVAFIDDTATAAAPTTIAEADVLRIWTGNPKNQLASAGDRNFVRFTPRGETRPATGLTLTMKPKADCSAEQRSVISVSAMGRPSSQRMACTD